MRIVTVTVAVVLAAGLVLAEDKLILRDGQVVTGKILSTSEGDVTIQSGDETMRVPRWAIESIEREDAQGRVSTVKPTQKIRQPPPKQRRGAGTRRVPPGPPLAGREFPEPTPELLAWVEVCVEHLGSEDEGVRAGARTALRFTGPAARPALESAAAGDGQAATEAGRVLVYLDGVERRMERRKAQKIAADAATPAARLGEQLGLSEEQVPQFKTIIEDYYDQQTALAQSVRKGELEVADASQRVVELRDELERKLAPLLTEQQMEQLREKMPRHEGGATHP
jgi:hypothetical protein